MCRLISQCARSDPAMAHDGADVAAKLANGTTATRRIRNRGRPMTDAELDAKSAAPAEGVLSRADILTATSHAYAASKP